ncbi:hypothetical protein KAF25_008859 [Fusarium avenaceum]|uniref:Protection of telomeres protein 1 n=1 Tax=Fusarium avenaceum TaxID=40199 RepID=A0A9P7KP99_9HYPO|nr:hypothetical protein KAF25_008859 [Fusarium avenaceum]
MPPSSALTLPNYAAIRDLLDGKNRPNSIVNVVGIVVDFRAPVPTRGKDWKCQIRFYDSSIEDDDSISVNIFRPENEFPKVGCGDVLLLRHVKVQRYGSDVCSLLTNYNTKISAYEASRIPKPPGEASCALYPPPCTKDTPPSVNESTFVSQLYHSIDKDRIPSREEYEVMVVTSANVKNKFSLLKDLKDGQFCDIVTQVVRPPHDAGDKITIWVSDYTENPAFYKFSIGMDGSSFGRDGDPYGYTDKFMVDTASSQWPGPYGRRCLQITCWEPHATIVRESRIEPLTWVSIKNLQIKMGRNGSNLEGYLREDRGSFGTRIGIQAIDSNADSENFDPRAKEALQRKREYDRLRKGQIKEIKEASKAGQKRKNCVDNNTEQKKENAKTRRSEKRKNKNKNKNNKQDQIDDQVEQDTVHVADLNTNVKCENQDKPPSLISEIKALVRQETTIEGQSVKLSLPFVNLNYRANVRVVDFAPSDLMDFAYPKKKSEYDDLSDDGGESVSDSGSEEEDGQSGQVTLDNFTKVRNWEWRFFLELEDAAVPAKQKKERLWVAVDNQAAQCLLSLDASNLRQDKEALTTLREKMFILWGNLEERKTAAQEAARQGRPPADSDDEDQRRPETAKSGKVPLTNRVFPCCIQQFGVKVPESNPSAANAGDKKRWQRMHRLFGSMIAGL